MDATSVPVCGIVMPISAIDDCTEGHWSDVQEILTEAIEKAGFQANLVSNADDVGIIQKRIIQNLYDNPVVVVDVSGKNPNVMFELGMRLAFDKPTILVKDDRTKYSFDTSPIEHLEYPRDLRFGKIVDFKSRLSEKIAATAARAQSDRDYTTFLKHFGEFVVAKIDKKEVSGQEYTIDELRSMRRLIQSSSINRSVSASTTKGRRLSLCLGGFTDEVVEQAKDKMLTFPGVTSVGVHEFDSGHEHLDLRVDESFGLSQEDAYDFLNLPPRKRRASRRGQEDGASGMS